jgi:hypothetical protein
VVRRSRRERIGSAVLRAMVCVLMGLGEARAQVRGVYPLGMSAINSGVTPEPGFSYANQLLFYSRNEQKGADGQPLVTGNNSVILAMNSFVWVSRTEVLHGARFSMSATLPIANNSLTSDVAGAISGGGGFGDSYYQPFILGWQKKRAAIRTVYGFLAPTGRFDASATSNVGSGYWTHVLSSGQTFYLTRSNATSVSAFQMYEFHGTQEGTHIHPGQTLDLDYSVMQMISPRDDVRVHVGLVGYNQRQTTDRAGAGITPEQAAARYSVNALGFASTVSWPDRKVSLGFKYFKEFANRSTFQGYSTQISGSISF